MGVEEIVGGCERPRDRNREDCCARKMSVRTRRKTGESGTHGENRVWSPTIPVSTCVCRARSPLRQPLTNIFLRHVSLHPPLSFVLSPTINLPRDRKMSSFVILVSKITLHCLVTMQRSLAIYQYTVPEIFNTYLSFLHLCINPYIFCFNNTAIIFIEFIP